MSKHPWGTALCEVAHAAVVIHQVTGTWPTLFAYPYGQSGDYLQDEYFPEFLEQHKTQAAFGTDAMPVTVDSPRWNLPHYVYGADWKTQTKLQQLLADVRRACVDGTCERRVTRQRKRSKNAWGGE